MNKKAVIDAIMYCYGMNKAEATRFYMKISETTRREILNSLKHDAKQAFYND